MSATEDHPGKRPTNHAGEFPIFGDLRSFEPCNEQERLDKQAILAYLDGHPDAFGREDPVAHVTVSAWIVNGASPMPGRAESTPEEECKPTKVLMVHHNIYNSWAWVGGHADGEHDLLQVALREAREETGVVGVRPLDTKPFSVEILPVSGHEKRGAYVSSHLHLNVTYLLEAREDEVLAACPGENTAVAWFAFEDALAASTEPWFVERIYRKLIGKLAG